MIIVPMDVHAASFTYVTMTAKGQHSRAVKRPMSAQELIAAVQAIAGPKTVVIEEGPEAQWLKETLRRDADHVVICDPRQNRLIAEANFIDDAHSAIALGELYLGGYTKEVVHPDTQGAELRRHFIHYYGWNRHLVRAKSQLKAAFRQAGVHATGSNVYAPRHREQYREQLASEPALREHAERLWELIDLVEAAKSKALQSGYRLARKNKAYALMDSLPGADKVISTGYVALIGTASRFPKKNRLWSYFGLGNKRQLSGHTKDSTEASQGGNRIGKWLVGQHCRAVLNRKDSNRFKEHYLDCRSNGLSEGDAQRSTCRCLLSVARTLWIKGEKYNESL